MPLNIKESLLSGSKLSDELEFVKRHAEQLATQKIKYSATHVPAVEHRPRKAPVANIPVIEPPVGMEEDVPVLPETISLTIKSAKPPLLFTLSAPSTSTISTLKALLSSSEPTAPAPDAQRWILKGKAMGDGKLLREFAVEDGAVVNLMVKAVVAPTPEPAAVEVPFVPMSEGPIPTFTVSSEPSSRLGGIPPIATSLPDSAFASPTTISPGTMGESAHFISTVSSPSLWKDAYALLQRHFGATEEGQVEAKKAWESWLSGSREYISASDKALIREHVGVSAMGGF